MTYDRTKCIACGKPYNPNHHCSPKFEAAVKAAQTKANNEELYLMYNPKPRTMNQRLTEGFALLGK